MVSFSYQKPLVQKVLASLQVWWIYAVRSPQTCPKKKDLRYSENRFYIHGLLARAAFKQRKVNLSSCVSHAVCMSLLNFTLTFLFYTRVYTMYTDLNIFHCCTWNEKLEVWKIHRIIIYTCQWQFPSRVWCYKYESKYRNVTDKKWIKAYHSPRSHRSTVL